MSFSWQDAVALAVVAVAVLYLARQAQLILRRKRAGGCTTACAKCPADATTPDVVTLEAPKSSLTR